MSIVIGYVSNKFILMSADKRSLKWDGTVFDENKSKIFKLGNNILIGFTGSAGVVDVLKDCGYLNSSINANPSEYCKKLYCDIGGGKVTNEEIKVTNILILGKENSQGYGANFNLADKGIQNIKYLATENEVWTPILTPPNVDYNYWQNLYRFEMVKIHKSSTSLNEYILKIKKLHTDIINKISKLDSSVNRAVESFVLTI